MNFHYHLANLLFKTGANRGQQGFIEKKDESFSWSTIIAFSKKRIYGVVSTIGTFTSKEIKGFYYHIFKSRFEDFEETEDIPVIVCDNASIHKLLEIREFIKNSGVTILTIVPYFPWLNPTEHLIGSIKSKMKQQLNQWKKALNI